MKSIMVAVDGSDHALSALSVACSLARQHDARILIVHVVTGREASEEALLAMEVEYADEFAERTRSLFGESALPSGAQYASMMLSNRASANRIINSIMGEKILSQAESYVQRHGVDAVNTLLSEGNPADKLVDLSSEHGVDTIVIGCRGVSRVAGLVLGSVSQSVAHRAEASVIMVK